MSKLMGTAMTDCDLVRLSFLFSRLGLGREPNRRRKIPRRAVSILTFHPSSLFVFRSG